LTLSGSAQATVAAGQYFEFRPSVTNTTGLTVVFTAPDLPDWLTLNPQTGELTGTPAATEVGTYTGITVEATAGTATVSLTLDPITVTQFATGVATVSWVAPTENTDGSALTDLAGFKIRYGRSGSLLDRSIVVSGAGVTRYVLSDLGLGAWYFAVVAFNSRGLEGAQSNVVSKTIS